MLPLIKQQSSTVSPKMPSESGLMRDVSNLSPPKVDTGDTSSPTIIPPPHPTLRKNVKTSSMLEFRLENKKMTLNVKSHSSRTSTPPSSSCLTSDQDSTQNVPDSAKYWKEFSKELSTKLWLPTEIDLAGLDTHYLSGYSNNTVPLSFVIPQKNPRIKKTSWPSLLSIQPSTMEAESINDPYTRKVRFYPSPAHKILLSKCFGTTRYLINQAIESIRDGKLKKYSHLTLRNHLMYRDKNLTDHNAWLREIPYDTRDEAMRQLAANIKSNFTKLKRKQITKFVMRFKSKRHARQVCYINKTALNIKKRTLFVQRVKEPLRFAEDISGFKPGTLTVLREHGRYYMCFPLERERTNSKTSDIIALDPGVCTFQTLYTPDGTVGKLGHEMRGILRDKYKREDKLKSILSKLKEHRKRYNLRKRCGVLRTKVRNIVVDFHRKTCSWLTNNFGHILLPNFKVKNMVNKSDRNIGKSTVRGMLSLSHYKFRQRLLEMGQSRGCKVYICNEAHTTQACGRCGILNKKVKGSRTFNCNHCKVKVDRDYNGARNILIKHLIKD